MQKQNMTTFSGWVRRNRILPKKRVVYLPVDVLNELRQMNPREAAIILINM